MSEVHETRKTPTNRSARGLSLLWPILAISYLGASACGYRGIATGIVGLMVGTLLAASGRPAAGAITGLILSSAGLYWSDSAFLIVYLPPLAGFAFIAFFFQRTLRPGSEPLITRVARKEHSDLPTEIVRYTRALTWIWVWCFVLLLAIAFLLAPILPLHAWSRWMQGLAIVVPGTLFLGEYAYRHHRLRDHHHASLLQLTLNIIAVIKEAAIKTAPADSADSPRP